MVIRMIQSGVLTACRGTKVKLPLINGSNKAAPTISNGPRHSCLLSLRRFSLLTANNLLETKSKRKRKSRLKTKHGNIPELVRRRVSLEQGSWTKGTAQENARRLHQTAGSRHPSRLLEERDISSYITTIDQNPRTEEVPLRFHKTKLKVSEIETRRPISQPQPLRILFCGSDEFSCASLQALAELQQRSPKLIESIDVMIRPGKPSGRSMKSVREVPIKAVAQALDLRIHERDTFTGWEPPAVNGKPINLIIAVSFGLFVPPRILKGAFYGGLNVHPSLLPNLRGPAPIHHTILTKQRWTGVTLQTLHPEKFDHGMILSRTDNLVKLSDDLKYADLHKTLTPLGAKLLVNSLERNLHVPPCKDIGGAKLRHAKLEHAPKVTAADRRMDLAQSYNFMSQYRAFGRLWADICIDEISTKRIVFEDFEKCDYYAKTPSYDETGKDCTRPLIPKDTNIELDDTAEPAVAGVRVLVSPSADGEKRPIFYTELGDAIFLVLPHERKNNRTKPLLLRVTKITIAGETTKSAVGALRSLQKSGKWIIKKPDKTPFDLRQYRFARLPLWGSQVKGFLANPQVSGTKKILQDVLANGKEEKKYGEGLSRTQDKAVLALLGATKLKSDQDVLAPWEQATKGLAGLHWITEETVPLLRDQANPIGDKDVLAPAMQEEENTRLSEEIKEEVDSFSSSETEPRSNSNVLSHEEQKDKDLSETSKEIVPPSPAHTESTSDNNGLARHELQEDDATITHYHKG